MLKGTYKGNRGRRRPRPTRCQCWGVAAVHPSDPPARHAEWCPVYRILDPEIHDKYCTCTSCVPPWDVVHP